MQQVVHLAADGPHFHLRIEQAGGADDLLDHRAGRLGQLIRARRGGNVDDLVDAILEFFERERTVVERAGQAESEFDQRLFARTVAMIHALKLRDGLVAFVEEHQRIVRKIIEQRGRGLAGQAAGKMARIILDAVAVADLADHFQIEHGALPEALGLDPLALLFRARLSTIAARFRCCVKASARVSGAHHVMGLGINRQAQIVLLHLAGAADRSAPAIRSHRPTG